MSRSCLCWLYSLIALLSVSQYALSADQEEVEFFEKKIRPVLVEHCYKCHSSDSEALKGGLSVDHRAAMLTGGDSGPAIEPGNAEESLLLTSMKYESYEMPPAGKLPEAVIKDFELWIANGAVDPREPPKNVKQVRGIDWEAARQFWAFVPLPENPYPATLTTPQRTAVIDQQIAQQLAASGMPANPPAAPEKRIRKLYYDLTGLPPTPQQILEFVNDPTQARWEKTVDELLASQQFGEKWGRHWLDVVRYADSNGGDFNATFHNAWRYRDYVIESFNNDKPINEFFQEQVAGDLLPAATDDDRRENIVATGFLMLGPKMLSERDKEKLKFDVIDEQIDTFGKVFLGLSLGCARCHDHKFDPVPTADYYALAGIFQGTHVFEGEIIKYVSNWLRRDLPTSPEHLQSVRDYEQKLSDLQKQLKTEEATLKIQKETIERLQQGGEILTLDNTLAKQIGAWKSSTFASPFVGTDYIHDNKEDKGKKEVLFSTQFQQAGRYQVLFGYLASSGRDERVPVQVTCNGKTTEYFVDETKVPEVQGTYTLLGEHEFPAGATVEVRISNAGTTGYVIVDAVQFVRVSDTDTSTNKQALAKAQSELKAQQKVVIALRQEIKDLQAKPPVPVPQAIAVQDLQESCEDCSIMIRGEHTNPGAVVPRGTLKIISGADSTLEIAHGSGRKELSDWLVTQASSLSSRVYVNRVWMYLLGEGIVPSVDNFGSQGIAPSHPELLDQLALQFMATNWSTKQLIRSIVFSEAYQRSTVHQQENFLKDPENRLLWRANRRPLTSEEIRDTLILLQNQLNYEHGGSTVAHLGQLVVNNNSKVDSSHNSDYLTRRTVYLPVLRSKLDEISMLFDFASPEMVVGKRPVTNVPSQALYLLNHPELRATALTLVDHMFEKHGSGSFSGLPDLYLQIYGRLPQKTDDQILQAYLEEKLQGEIEPDKVRSAWGEVVQSLLISTEFRYLD